MPRVNAFSPFVTRHVFAAPAILMAALGVSNPLSAQSNEPSVALVVESGTPLRVALDRRTVVKRVGQQVAATLIEPVYAYDRVVLPIGTKAIGHIDTIESAGKRSRLHAIMSGDFTPPRRVGLQFDRVVLSDGRDMAIRTVTTEGAENVVLRIAGDTNKNSVASRARQEIARQAKEAASVITAPDKSERFKDAAIRALPYHPIFLRKGTVYTARLLSALPFGSATPALRAPAGAAPAPESLLSARLATPIASGTSPQGTRIVAVLTRPVNSADGRLILPAGARLTGEVTFSKGARRFRRHGQLRFLFETIQPPDQTEQSLLASLYAVESRAGDRVILDEEGGATSASSKARLAAPALAALALVGAMHGRLDYDTDGAGPEMQYGGVGSSTLGGFLGAGLFGIGVNQLGRPFTLATTSFGLARTLYATVFAKGREISFPVDTAIQVQLAPGPSKPPEHEEERP
jgi:hypothetical protein